MLDAAKLGTLSEIRPRRHRGERDLVDMPRIRISLASELGYPEAVNNIGRLEMDHDLLANWHMQLVSGHNSLIRIIKLPPPLVRHYPNGQWIGRGRGGLVHGLNRKDKNNDQ